MLKFYPHRFGLVIDALVGSIAAVLISAAGIAALGKLSPRVAIAVFGPFVVGFLVLATISTVWLLGRLTTLEASEEGFAVRRLWGWRSKAKWSDVAEISQTVLPGAGGNPDGGELALRFVLRSEGAGRSVSVSQRRLAMPLNEIVAELVARTGARYVLTVQREAPPEWRRRRGSSLLKIAFVVLGLGALLGGVWFLGR